MVDPGKCHGSFRELEYAVHEFPFLARAGARERLLELRDERLPFLLPGESESFAISLSKSNSGVVSMIMNRRVPRR